MWKTTKQIRFVKRLELAEKFGLSQPYEIEVKQLQQLWVNDFGKTEWRDVPIVEEEEK